MGWDDGYKWDDQENFNGGSSSANQANGNVLSDSK